MTDNNGWHEHKLEIEHRLSDLERSRREHWQEIHTMDRRLVKLETKVAAYAAASSALVMIVVEGVKFALAR